MLTGINEKGELENLKTENGALLVKVINEGGSGTDINEYFNKKPTDENKTIIKKIPDDIDTSELTDTSYLFSNILVDSIPQIDTSNVINMSSMFEGCKNITTIPEINTTSVKNMSNMFADCENLISIPQIDTSSVTEMTRMFYNCKNLVSIPEIDTSNVETMSSTFEGCANLVTVPQLNLENARQLMYIFRGCKSLSHESLLNIINSCINTPNIFIKDISIALGFNEEQLNSLSEEELAPLIEAGWSKGTPMVDY